MVTLKAKGYLGVQYEPLVHTLLLPELHGSRVELESTVTFPLSVINQGWLFFRYLVIWLFPYPGWLSIDLRVPFPARLVSWPYTFGFAAYLAYPVIALAQIRKGGTKGLIGFGLLYPWLLGLTEVATVRIQEPFVLYRSYLWMSGLPALLQALFARLRATWSIAILTGACVALVPPFLDRVDSFSSAIKLWEDAVQKNIDLDAPFVERSYHNRGFAYLQSKRYSAARQDFDKAIEINAQDADAYLGRGVLLSRTGDQQGALAELSRAIEIDPGYAEAHGKRCFVKMMLGEPAAALADCETSVTLDSGHRENLTNLGVVYAALNRAVEAETTYRRALEIDPADGETHYNFGVLLVTLGRGTEARRHLVSACKAHVDDACQLLANAFRAR